MKRAATTRRTCCNRFWTRWTRPGERLTNVERDAIGELQRVSFPLVATKKQHEQLQANCSPSRPSMLCSPSAIRRKIDSLHQGACLRQRLSDRHRRRRRGHDWPNLRAVCARAIPASARTASSSLPGPGRGQAASACTMRTAPLPKSAATAPAAWPHGWREELGAQPGDSLEIATDAGVRVCHIDSVSTDEAFTVEVTTGMGVPQFAPRTVTHSRGSSGCRRRSLHGQSALRHRRGQRRISQSMASNGKVSAQQICVHPDFPIRPTWNSCAS